MEVGGGGVEDEVSIATLPPLSSLFPVTYPLVKINFSSQPLVLYLTIIVLNILFYIERSCLQKLIQLNRAFRFNRVEKDNQIFKF